MKMEAGRSSETSVNFYRTTRRYIPEDGTLHKHRCDNLKYNRVYAFIFLEYLHLHNHNIRLSMKIIWIHDEES
jgi:hypothetical protein